MAGKVGRPKKVEPTDTMGEIVRRAPGVAGHNIPGQNRQSTIGQRLGNIIGECMAEYWQQFGAAQGNPELLGDILTQLRSNVGVVQACVTGFEALETQIVTTIRGAQTATSGLSSVTA